MNDPYDPKLKEAMAEIKAILKKHDIGGAVSLASQTHAEFLYDFPTWSIAQLETPQGLRVRSKREDYPSEEAQHLAAEATLHMLLRFQDIAVQTFNVVEVVEQKLKEDGWIIEHESGRGFTPHRDT